LNIPIKNILSKIEQEAIKAKGSLSRDEVEARLLVIRSLCDVVLETKEEQNDFTEIQDTTKTEDFSSLELEKMMGIQKPKKPSLTSTRVVEEDGANGDSIFDF